MGAIPPVFQRWTHILGFCAFHGSINCLSLSLANPYWTLQDQPNDIFAFYSFFYTVGCILFIDLVYRAYRRQPSNERNGIVIGAFLIVVVLLSLMSIRSYSHS
jgi:hypothetical protein